MSFPYPSDRVETNSVCVAIAMQCPRRPIHAGSNAESFIHDLSSTLCRREGATYKQLQVLRNAPADDFVDGTMLDSDCPYSWRSVLSGGLKNMKIVFIPLRCSPSQVSMTYLARVRAIMYYPNVISEKSFLLRIINV